MANPPAGMYPDPESPGAERYWDGEHWAAPGVKAPSTEPPAPVVTPPAAPAGPSGPPVAGPVGPPAGPPTAPPVTGPVGLPVAPPYMGSQYATPVKPTNQLALWSMISSLIGIFCGVGTIVGIILGFVALGQLKEPGNTQEGKGMAKAGIIIGFCVIGLWILLFAVGGIFGHNTTYTYN